MGILNLLFGNKVEIEDTIDDPILGKLSWDEDEESWRGNYLGYEILLALESGMSAPSDELRLYAIDILNSDGFLARELDSVKQSYIADILESEDEVTRLDYVDINFYRYKSKYNRIIASLGPGENYRAWRIEFGEKSCEGLGFDS